MSKFKKICLLKGGISTEREVSLASAKEFAEALRELQYDFVEFDFLGDYAAMSRFLRAESVDCVLNGLHGGVGEDGNVQAVLDFMRMPYTHSGVIASALAMNKKLSREMFAKNGLPIAEGRVVEWKSFLQNPDFEYPFVVKEIDGGSSAGVFIVNNSEELHEINWKYDDNVLIEKYIPGRELTVGVMSGAALEVTEIFVKTGFYDYHNKYASGGSFHELPAKIPENIRKQVMEMALKAHNVLGCREISRSDFRYDDKEGKLYILEVNSQPGMTKTSLLPEQAKFVGISFNELVQYMIEEAACFDICYQY